MNLRVAHIGNVAQNAYNAAKFLRRYTDVAADSFDYGGGTALWHPAWEDGEFPLERLPDAERLWQWSRVPMTNGWARPSWAKILGPPGAPAWFDTDADYYDWLLATAPNRFCAPVVDVAWTGALQPHRTAAALRTAGTAPAPAPGAAAARMGFFFGQTVEALRYAPSVQAIAEAYDLVVLYGPQAMHGVTLPRPYVTFEHATMRHVEQRRRMEQQYLAESYLRAAHNILTNADCVRSAQALGLSPHRYSFIPHPVDTETFSPFPTPHSTQLWEALRDWSGCDVIALMPTRHSDRESSGKKETVTALQAYARYVQQAEPKGAPRMHLLLCAWGSELAQSQALLREWGVDGRVSWYPLIPKRLLADLYRACDVVLDQFSPDVGSYGTITVEALATGTPVITYVDTGVHEWCADVLPPPPVCNALTVEQVYDHLLTLATDEGARVAAGHRGWEWVERWHGPERVARLHAALYARVLAGECGAMAPPATSSTVEAHA